MKISYAITACNEHEELQRLLNLLTKHIRDEDEIIIQLDNIASHEIRDIVWNFTKEKNITNILGIEFPLNKDFATFKNNLKNHCKGDIIFFIDADEIPAQDLIEALPILAEQNIDVISVPRINTVKNITPEHIKKWGWKIDEFGRINYADYQMRICKNIPEIKWKNKVHEVLDGYKTYSYLPTDMNSGDLHLYHPKTIERQEKQNDFYNTI
jgi:hypothetical protein